MGEERGKRRKGKKKGKGVDEKKIVRNKVDRNSNNGCRKREKWKRGRRRKEEWR